MRHQKETIKSQSELGLAIEENNIFMVNRFAKKADVKSLTAALIRAIHDGKHDICKALVLHGAVCNAHYGSGQLDFLIDKSTPFIDLIRRGYFDIVDILLKRKYYIDFNNDASMEVIYEALIMCDEKHLRMIIKNNYSYQKIPNDVIERFILWAAGDDKGDLINVLLERTHSLSQKNLSDSLHLACRNGSLDAVKVLIKHDPDILANNLDNMTLLHSLCEDALSLGRYRKRSGLSLRMRFYELGKWFPPVEFFDIDSVEESTYVTTADKKTRIFELLCASPCNINYQNNEGDTILRLAIMKNFPLKFIEAVLNHGAEINGGNFEGDSPIHLVQGMAISWNHNGLFKLLMRYGADINLKDKNHLTPLERVVKDKNTHGICELMEAEVKPLVQRANIQNLFLKALVMKNPNSQLLEYLIQLGASVNDQDSEGNTVLKLACIYGSEWLLNYLIKIDHDFNETDCEGNNIFHWLGQHCAYISDKTIDLLIEKCPEINSINIQGLSPLFVSIQHKSRWLSLKLLENGASLKGADSQGRSIFHYLAINMDILMLKKVLKAADLSNMILIDHHGKTPLHYLSEKDFFYCHNVSEFIEDTVSLGVKIDAKDIEGKTALHWAAINHNCKLIDELIRQGASPLIQDQLGIFPYLYLLTDPLMRDCDCFQKAIHSLGCSYRDVFTGEMHGKIALLNLDKLDILGWGAIHYAALFGYQEFMSALVMLGANPDSKSAYGETPNQILECTIRYLE